MGESYRADTLRHLVTGYSNIGRDKHRPVLSNTFVLF